MAADSQYDIILTITSSNNYQLDIILIGKMINALMRKMP